MKLLRVIHSLSPLTGGPVEGLCRITPYLEKLGVSTTVVCLDHPNSDWLNFDSFQTIPLGPAPLGYGYIPRLSQTIRQIAHHHDVVVIHGVWQYHSYATYKALKDLTIPYFIYPHGMLDPWFKKAYPLKHLKKLLYWSFFESQVFRFSSGILFTSKRECISARSCFLSFPTRDIFVGYGTSLPPLDASNQLDAFFVRFPQLYSKKILLYLGRIHPKKGLDLLIHAFSLVSNYDPRLHLVIAGPDQIGWKSELESLSHSYHITHRITWAGMLVGDLKWGAFRAADLFCLPSHQENFGIAAAEALSCGLPVMISDQVNISEDVQSYGAGIIHTDTLHGTKAALGEWLSASEEVKSQMSVSARSLFLDKYDLSSISLKLYTLLSDSLT